MKKMEKRLKIYLDSSVPSAYFDSTRPERQQETQGFWKRIDQYEIFISDLVIKELNRTPARERREDLLKCVNGITVLPSGSEMVTDLAQEYFHEGAIPIIEDAIHIAVATAYDLDVVASWNFRHMVNLKTKKRVNAINSLKGYHLIEILDPSML